MKLTYVLGKGEVEALVHKNFPKKNLKGRTIEKVDIDWDKGTCTIYVADEVSTPAGDRGVEAP